MADVSALIRQRAAENEAWRESRQEERTNLSVMRDASVEEITGSPEQYMNYLRLQGDNIQCSVGNVALTMFQLKSATRIGSLSFWHEQGRSVRDEEMKNGAKVFVPPRNKKYRGYIVGDYYDISQTTGKPLREAPRLSENGKKMEEALKRLFYYVPVPLVEDGEMSAPAYYDAERLELAVNPTYSDGEIFAALATEIAYARFHDKGRNQYFDRDACALDAESVGYLLCRRFGVECPEPKTQGVGQHYEDFEPGDRIDALDELRKTARDIGEGIDKSIQPRQQDRSRRGQFGR